MHRLCFFTGNLEHTQSTSLMFLCQPFNAQCPKMARHTLKNLQHLLQDF